MNNNKNKDYIGKKKKKDYSVCREKEVSGLHQLPSPEATTKEFVFPSRHSTRILSTETEDLLC